MVGRVVPVQLFGVAVFGGTGGSADRQEGLGRELFAVFRRAVSRTVDSAAVAV